jgi:starch synthase
MTRLFGHLTRPDLYTWGGPEATATRFALFSKVAAMFGMGTGFEGQRFDLLHAHDWQGALVPAYLDASGDPERAKSVVTIHNLDHKGMSDLRPADIDLPAHMFAMQGLEAWGQLALLKGLVYADHVTTVSPTYAAETQTKRFGSGFEHLLHDLASAGHYSGMPNGVGPEWDPRKDTLIEKQYSTPEGKAPNKAALQRELGLTEDPDALMLGVIARLTEQKGIDTALGGFRIHAALPEGQKTQLVILGTGDKQWERDAREVARDFPGQVSANITFNERLAHMIEAGADVFLMPSRFEPCGLNQMYSMKYGTIPIVAGVGGLRDTVFDTTAINIVSGAATGRILPENTPQAMAGAISEFAKLYQLPHSNVLERMQKAGMASDFSWETMVKPYEKLYERLLDE